MFRRICLLLALLGTLPIWAQVEPSATDDRVSETDSLMTLPLPVSGVIAPLAPIPEGPSNFIEGGLRVSTAYVDNVLTGSTSAPVQDAVYSLNPALTFEQRGPRVLLSSTYDVGALLYQPTNVLDSVNQNGLATFQYRIRRHLTMSIREALQQNSTIFTQPYQYVEAGLGGSGQPQTALILPFANQISNATEGNLAYQFSKSAMVGGGTSFSILHYPRQSQSPGLYSGQSVGGTGFYVRRIAETQYLGAIYNYARIVTSGLSDTTRTGGLRCFYAVGFTPSLFLSLEAGGEHFDSSSGTNLRIAEWQPRLAARFSIRTTRFTTDLNVVREISAGEGLPGAYKSSSAGASTSWKLSRRLSTGVTGSYAGLTRLTPQIPASNPGGHTLFGAASFRDEINNRVTLELEFDRLHQTYSGISAIDNAPDGDRVSATLQYHFARPVGR